eukprot:CAMPEP_0170561742 /NCGR_PEP_ID=MMETSP0211-20121228/56734_1 /TAXON_ID=311385 /ORGANISM="Pseudokeronopsis sp., Strain OXSARD2" /LENGTH=125 /DNA_ID=CAMNT_0010877715 /DNA_START=644 /DNA_END=1021 /DNA_ORIENTATION=+
MPVSAAFANDEIMSVIKPGDHGTTYGGNALGMTVAKAAISTLMEEGLVENSAKMGEILLDKLSAIKSPLIKDVRGQGLFLAIEMKRDLYVNGNDLAECLMMRGLTTKPTHTYTLRFSPTLAITEP